MSENESETTTVEIKPPSRFTLLASVFSGLLLILVIDTAFFTTLVLILIIIFGSLGYHISIYK